MAKTGSKPKKEVRKAPSQSHNLPAPTDNTNKKRKKNRSMGYESCLAFFILGLGFSCIGLYVFMTPTLEKQPPIHGPTFNNKTWGTYRSHAYFGLRTRLEKSPLFGMMWYEQPDGMYHPRIRHNCDQGDGISRYGWVSADGRTFGRQNITEKEGPIRIDWLNDKNGFTSNVRFNMIKGKRYSLIFYLVSQDSASRFNIDHHHSGVITGTSDVFGDMRLSLASHQLSDVSHSTLVVDDDIRLDKLHEYVLANTRAMETPKGLVFVLNENHPTRSGRLAIIQLNIENKFDVEVSLKVGAHSPVRGEEFKNELAKRENKFNQKFEEVFALQNKNYTTVQLDMAKVALSNMLGAIGYWHGYNKVLLPSGEVQHFGPQTLFSAVPSRSYFPRGFLWDEGFHNMLIRKFDPKLSLEIIVSWMNTMDKTGWIAREQILGVEAEARVPAEFVIQHTDVANPPSLFYVIDKLVHDEQVVSKYGLVLARIYPRLEQWYAWLQRSQAGKVKNGFRWRGRNATTTIELNPKTLASGLDDYPRASHPTDDELHLDLRCWLALCARVLERLSKLYGTDAEHRRYSNHKEELTDINELVKMHWSEDHGAFFDFGRHSENIGLTKVPTQSDPRGYEFKRVTSHAATPKLVSDVFGYNSLFPLMLRLVPADSKYLKLTLDKIRDPNVLWTDYGLRSLSRKSPYYRARNTEHDPPYWRGYIWINVNYMTLSALRHYADVKGPYQQDAENIFQELRKNLVTNMADQFNRTGYIWENYDDRTGEGRGSHPFNGWSSLILMIMSDNLET